MTDRSSRRRIPTWRKIGAIAFFVAVVGPLLFGMFYSYFTKTDPQEDIASAAAYTYPYLVYIVPIILAIGILDLIHHYGRKKSS